MLGNVIGPLNVNPKGIFMEGLAGDTSEPGTQMQIQAGVAPVGGRFTYIHYQPSSDGDPRLTIVLREDQGQGFAASVLTPAVIGTRIFLYIPVPGDEMNILVKGQQGTGSSNAFTIGERLIPQAASGKQIVESTSSVSATWMVLEHLDEVPDTDTLIWCQKA